MRHVTCIVAIGALALAVTGCTDPYGPGSGYSQGYNYPSAYSYPANGSYPASSGYYPNRYGYGPGADYNRNYGEPSSGPQVTFSFP